MKPAEAVSSSGLSDYQTRPTNFEPTTTIYRLPKRKKKKNPLRSIASNCPDTLTVCYGGGWGTADAVAATCVPTALAVAATCVRRRGARQVETTSAATTSDSTMHPLAQRALPHNSGSHCSEWPSRLSSSFSLLTR